MMHARCSGNNKTATTKNVRRKLSREASRKYTRRVDYRDAGWGADHRRMIMSRRIESLASQVAFGQIGYLADTSPSQYGGYAQSQMCLKVGQHMVGAFEMPQTNDSLLSTLTTPCREHERCVGVGV